MEQTNQEMTFGQKLVGLSFTPSALPDVDRVKVICAELADLVNDKCEIKGGVVLNGIPRMLCEHTIGEILNAQMNVVKLLTYKD